MADYEKMYKLLFHGITDAIRNLKQRDLGGAIDILISTQQAAEEIYIQTAEEPACRDISFDLPQEKQRL